MSTGFDKVQVREISQDITRALQEVAEKHGVNIERKGTIRYLDSDFTMKLSVSKSDLMKEKMNEAGDILGLGKYAMGREFNCPTPGGKDRFFVICEIATCRKWAVVAARSDNGKKYRFTADTVKKGMEIL
jgi:hypothetical protein